ncbi:MAG: baseplate J/gp47 family protein [Anaerovoracaceae bacterium]
MAYEWEYLDQYNFNNMMQRCLNSLGDDIDQRPGSVAYDLLGPALAELTQAYVQMQLFYENSHLETAAKKYLDYRCADFGIERILRTKAERIANTLGRDGKPIDIPIRSRYSTITDSNPVFYICTSKLSDGKFILTCETSGKIGNDYIGDLLPVEYNSQLGSIKVSTIYKPARDDETDEDLRARTLEWLRNKPFGGNVADYKLWCAKYDGIGQVQVYPTWNGGGTVKLSIIDPSNKPCSQEFIQQVKEDFDPEGTQGDGLGIVPIGHSVTVVTAEEKPINIEFTSMLDTDITIDSIQELAKKSITQYIEEVQKNWSKNDRLNNYKLSVYRSRIISSLIGIKGILNVVQVKINGIDQDLELEENKFKQEIPVIGEVVIIATS